MADISLSYYDKIQSSATKSATKLVDSAKDMGTKALGGKALASKLGVDDIVGKLPTGTGKLSTSSSIGGVKKLAMVGEPFKYSSLVDDNDRASTFLKSRMNIVDIFPCEYAMKLSLNTAGKGLEGKSMVTDFKPNINYTSAMARFAKMCTAYGIPQCHGIRLYVTDETTVSEQISNTYKDSFFQRILDNMRSAFQSISEIGRSVDSEFNTKSKALMDSAIEKTGGFLKKGASTVGADGANGLINDLEKLAKGASSLIVSGNKISLPKIWDSSDYRPAFSLTIKLMSPYGHPDAVQEFIVKPLLYLLLMAAPQTQDGVTYGNPFACTVKAYGVTKLNLATIASLSIRKGGSDTSFNIYKQPLTVDVSIDFETLVGGLAAFTDTNTYEKNQFAQTGADSIKSSSSASSVETPSAMLPTVGDLISALKPIDFYNQKNKTDPFATVRDVGRIGGTIGGVLSGGGFGDIFDTVLKGCGIFDLTNTTSLGSLVSAVDGMARQFGFSSKLSSSGLGPILNSFGTSSIGMGATMPGILGSSNTLLGYSNLFSSTTSAGLYGINGKANTLSTLLNNNILPFSTSLISTLTDGLAENGSLLNFNKSTLSGIVSDSSTLSFDQKTYSEVLASMQAESNSTLASLNYDLGSITPSTDQLAAREALRNIVEQNSEMAIFNTTYGQQLSSINTECIGAYETIGVSESMASESRYDTGDYTPVEE